MITIPPDALYAVASAWTVIEVARIIAASLKHKRDKEHPTTRPATKTAPKEGQQ